MSDNDGAQGHSEAVQARSELSELHGRMFSALEYGIECARDYFGERAFEPWLFSHIVRDKVIERFRELPEESLPEAFSLVRRPMSGVQIDCNQYQVRVFKKSGEDADEFLYPVGHSNGRQAFYNQQLYLPGMDLYFPVPKPNVAYVWESSSGGLELWLVCPNGFEGIWKPGQVRWSISIPHPAQSMEPAESFGGGEEEDLPINFEEAAQGPDGEV